MFRRSIIGALLLGVITLLITVLPIHAAPDTPATPAQENLHVFQAELSGSQEVPPVVTPARGRAAFVLDGDTNILYYRVIVWDIEDIQVAHLHPGLPGETGPAEITLFPNGDPLFNIEQPLGASVQLTQAQADTLLAGGYYINVHTVAHPPGEIRGQVVGFIPGEYRASLQATPLVVTDASGWARFRFTGTDYGTLNYDIRVSDIEDIIGAQLHPGLPTQIRSPEVDLNILPGVSPFIGTASLTAQQLADFLAGYHYLTVQTEVFPTGELRGQVEKAFIFYQPLIVN